MPLHTKERPQIQPSNAPYLVKPRGPSTWKGFDRARLLVSIGNPSYEDKKMASLVEWLSVRFKKMTIVVHDTIQRHNLVAEGLSPTEAFALAQSRGKAWLDRYESMIPNTMETKILRWDDIIALPGFEDHKAAIQQEYDHNSEFRSAIDTAVDTIIERRHKNAANMDVDAFRQNATTYLLEEAAGYIGMYKLENAADIYPGTRPEALLMVMRRDLPSLQNASWQQSFTRLGFTRRSI